MGGEGSLGMFITSGCINGGVSDEEDEFFFLLLSKESMKDETINHALMIIKLFSYFIG